MGVNFSSSWCGPQPWRCEEWASGLRNSAVPQKRVHSQTMWGAGRRVSPMDKKTADRELLASRFPQYAYLGKTFEKAVDAVLQGYVKAHAFVPSGRTIYT